MCFPVILETKLNRAFVNKDKYKVLHLCWSNMRQLQGLGNQNRSGEPYWTSQAEPAMYPCSDKGRAANSTILLQAKTPPAGQGKKLFPSIGYS